MIIGVSSALLLLINGIFSALVLVDDFMRSMPHKNPVNYNSNRMLLQNKFKVNGLLQNIL